MMQGLWSVRWEYWTEIRGVDKSKSQLEYAQTFCSRCSGVSCPSADGSQWKGTERTELGIRCTLEETCVKLFHFHYMNFAYGNETYAKTMNLTKINFFCLFCQRTVHCHSRKSKYKWQNSVSATHLGLTNIASDFIFFESLELYTIKEKWLLKNSDRISPV